MDYRLKYFDSVGEAARAEHIDAPDEETAIDECCKESIRSNMPIELWCRDSFIIRMTPLVAHLHGCDPAEAVADFRG